jgi:nucleoside triphosphate pyrophosphatase
VLASASPARLRVLREAGLRPEVLVSGVPEDGLDHLAPDKIAGILAERKAAAVAERLRGQDAYAQALVIGCDSVFDLDGSPLGKPDDAPDAVARWQEMRGRAGRLHTGHHLIDLGSDASAGEVATTVVRFGTPDDEEIAAYAGSGEPLSVAGAFTLDGRASAFIDGIDGDPSNVIGLSMPLLRRLLAQLSVRITDLWC